MTFDIEQFVNLSAEGMRFTQSQGNVFAKEVAGDFNPIHDVGAKRFCVPGDLLFAVLLHRFGVYKQLKLDLNAMVTADVLVPLPDALTGNDAIYDASERHLLTLETANENSTNPDFIRALTMEYVRFSGKTFPDILVDLMRRNDVMINPARPLVIYKDMSVQLDSFHSENIALELSNATLEVDGKKAKACLEFTISSNNDTIGQGKKNMVLGGLREYDEAAMQAIVDQYTQWKQAYGQAPA